ncbi:MAG: hypothetical protein KAT11_00110 [Phycisphaerae bacterium]|nr:hypothetical protein [Phycisphaerae bacterium]
MSLEEYYKIAEEKISQYDTHSFRCKQWLVVIVGALIAGAFYREKSDIQWPLLWAGLLATIVIFLIDMSFRHVVAILIVYTEKLEKKMTDESMIELHPAPDGWGLNANLSHSPKNNWLGLFSFIFFSLRRPRGMLFYIGAVIIILGGICMVTPLAAAQQTSDGGLLEGNRLGHHPSVVTHSEHRPDPTHRTHRGHERQWAHKAYCAQKTDAPLPVPCCSILLKYVRVILHAPLPLLLVILLIVRRICKTAYKVQKLPLRAKKD